MRTYNVAAFATLVLAAIPATVLADDVHCPADLGRVTIDGNVLVAAPCRLEGTTVKGNVHLYAGGSLIARDARIDGNIQAENSDFVDVAETHVNGSIQLDDLVGDRSIVTRGTVGGSIQLKSNRSRLEVLDNIVGADVQAFSNSGGVIVADNTIDGNLQCKSNHPAPAGGNNRVSGNKEDQCADLVPEAPASGAAQSSAAAADSTSGGAGGIHPLASLLLLALLLLRMQARRLAK